MARLSLSVLGSLQASLDGKPVQAFEYNKVKALLAYLAVEAGHPHSRESLAALLWPDLPDSAARKNLSQALSHLRSALREGGAARPFLLVTPQDLQFNPASDHELDLARFNALLAACAAHAHRRAEGCSACAQRLGQAVALYRDDFLAHFFLGDSAPFEEWAALQREALRQRALRALAQLVAYHERQGQPEPAIAFAQRQLALDPWREAAHRDLMRLLALTGQRNTALAHYQDFRQALAAELDASPEPETLALYERLRAAGPLPSVPAAQTHNFPARPDPFIGRQPELAQIAALLELPACRLLTLTGPGGVGKTRLAMAAAQQQAALFNDGVYFVPLAPLSSAEFFVSALAAALGLTFRRQPDPLDQLLDWVQTKELLLVLDNLEHLLAEPASAQSVAGLLSRLLAQAPRLSLLVTSRERLRLTGEWLFSVTGLESPPEVGALAAAYDAVEFFVSCARRADHTFRLAPGQLAPVAHICRLLAGLPLAIEMAASLAATLPPAELAQAIETSPDFLQAPARDVPERHSSLRAVFDSSWRLLTPAEQRALACLSVFRGGFERPAAERVAAVSPRQLAALVNKSLLRCDSAGRYDQHELVRQYGRNQLDQTSEAAAIQQHHAAYYLAVAETDSHVPGWGDRMTIEHGNFRAALAWSQSAPGGAELGLRLAIGLTTFCYYHGYWHEARAWLEGALAHPQAAAAAPAQAEALHTLGHLLALQGYYAAGYQRLSQSLALAEQLHDLRLNTRVRFELGVLTREQGQAAAARRWLEDSLAQSEALADPVGAAWARVTLAEVVLMLGEAELATALCEQALQAFRQRADQFGIAWALNHLGHAAQLQGAPARAAQLQADSLRLFQTLGENLGAAWASQSLGETALAQGQWSQAGDYFRQALQLFQDLGDQAGLAWCLAGLAGVAVHDQPAQAAQLWGVADSLQGRLGAREAPAATPTRQQLMARARDRLGAEAFAAAYAAGQAAAPAPVIAQLLQPDTPPPTPFPA